MIYYEIKLKPSLKLVLLLFWATTVVYILKCLNDEVAGENDIYSTVAVVNTFEGKRSWRVHMKDISHSFYVLYIIFVLRISVTNYVGSSTHPKSSKTIPATVISILRRRFTIPTYQVAKAARSFSCYI